ncbi:Golgi transport complex subunit 3 [Coemansia erecta]|uniref:Conserved oligomeric Golgi complex subunit 3 n=1 Tax=Coemansia erecta TaxID=147472 RepID=A0A9W8CPW2_9FUNG|nr:Golgi transport complex subunit 3 [Coemansia erecta]
MDWDAAYPVADDAAMRASIGAVQADSAHGRWAGPSGLVASSSSRSSPAPPHHQRVATPLPALSQPASLDAPIDTTARFLAWFDAATREAQQAQDHAQHTYSAHLHGHTQATHQLTTTLQECSAQLDQISAALASTQQLTLDATASSSQQTLAKLTKAHEAIAERLLEYDALQPIMAIVRAPGDACQDAKFLPALERAERAAGRIAAWEGQGRDDELYAMRFAQARTRALALIRMHVAEAFRRLAKDAAAAAAVDAAADARALYVAFRRPVARLRPLVRALEQRCAGRSGDNGDDSGDDNGGAREEARLVLAAVRQAYFGARRPPVRALVARRLAEIAQEHTGAGVGAGLSSPADVLRDWCAYAMNVCADERRVFLEYFVPAEGNDDDDGLDAFVEDVLGVLHEHVRPLVLAQGDVEVVAEMALALLTFQKPAEEDEEEDEEVDEGFAAFYGVVDRCVADAQQRLAFRAQAYVAQAIAQYRIAGDDAGHLARWVAACCAMHVADPPMLQRLLAEGDNGGSGSEDEVAALRWEYPPVAACRWLAALVDGCLDPDVQLGIGDEARAACRQNLLAHAARAVRDAPPPPSPKDAAPAAPEYNPENLAHLFVTYNLARIAD